MKLRSQKVLGDGPSQGKGKTPKNPHKRNSQPVAGLQDVLQCGAVNAGETCTNLPAQDCTSSPGALALAAKNKKAGKKGHPRIGPRICVGDVGELLVAVNFFVTNVMWIQLSMVVIVLLPSLWWTGPGGDMQVWT